MTTPPSWLAIHRGNRPLVLFAPHGGRRHAPREPGKHKVNDLHTAELTRELAARWDATALVNDSRDRNELDLNRISEVRRHAPWLPELLAELLAAMVDEHGTATLLVIHGWNAVQTVCDVGMGVVDREGRCVVATGGGCTASADFIASKIRRLQQRAAAAEIAVTIGARYPAAHHNNLLQLFTAAHRDDEDGAIRTLARLAGEGRVAAAQLELGIPLRWPGRFRNAFAAALEDVFTSAPDLDVPATARTRGTATIAAPTTSAAPARRAGEPRSAVSLASMHSRGLQFVAGDLLGFTSIDANGSRSTGGRLLLSPRPGTLALFTGELIRRRDPPWTVPGLRYVDEPGGGWRVRYDGPMLDFPTLTPFLDLEQGLARGALIETAVDLAFTPARPDAREPRRFGTVAGTIVLGGEQWEVSAGAVAGETGLLLPRRYPFCRLTLPDAGGGVELTSTTAVEESATGGTDATHTSVPLPDRRFRFELAGARHAGRSEENVGATCTLALSADGGRLELAAGDGISALEGACERLVPVRRPGRAGAVVHTIFAIVRFANRPSGWLELATEHHADPGAAEE